MFANCFYYVTHTSSYMKYFDYLKQILIKANVATDQGNNRNET